MRYFLFFLMFPLNLMADGFHVPPATQAGAPAWLPLAASFRTTQCSLPCSEEKSASWQMRRDQGAIELRGTGSPFSEMWRRSGDGRIDYVFLMHDEKRSIDYNPVDLKLADKTPHWERLGSLIAAADLDRLEPGEHGQRFGYATRSYRGELNGARVDVVWIPQLGLPASLQTTRDAQRVSIELLSIEATGTLPDAIAVPRDYQRVDYADLGDMEEDPQAQVWIRKAALAPGHQHHAH